MAADWWLFLEEGERSHPSFRHYAWFAPEISFGYGQDWDWVQKQIGPDADKIVRRPTGGGIVRHGKDWTYCLVLPNGHPSFSMPALDLYEKIHQAMFRCLKAQDLCFSETLPGAQAKRNTWRLFSRASREGSNDRRRKSKNCRSSHEKDKGGGTGSGLDGSWRFFRHWTAQNFSQPSSTKFPVLSANHPNMWIGRPNSPRGVVLSKKNSLLWPG